MDIEQRGITTYVAALVALNARWTAAVRRGDTRAANRNSNSIGDIFAKLNAEGTAGHHEIEALLTHSDPSIRMAAAQDLIWRKPEMAVPILGRLLTEDLREPSSALRVAIRQSSSDHLFLHFNIRSFDRNDLIEPLRRYGVELPPWVRPEFS